MPSRQPYIGTATLCWVIAFVFISAACGRPDRETRVTCDNAKRWLKLDDQAMARCLRDPSFRQEAATKTNALFAESLIATHNRDRAVLQLKGIGPKAFQTIERTSDLPVTTVGLGERNKQHIGKRYLLRARLSWNDPDGAEDEPTVWLYGLAAGLNERGNSNDRTMVAAHALNSYQREFLSRHCWSTSLGKPTSLCEGSMYLEIKRDPRGLFVSAELVGADLEEADSKVLLQYLERIRRTPVAGR
jgi:hypothetical protein